MKSQIKDPLPATFEETLIYLQSVLEDIKKFALQFDEKFSSMQATTDTESAENGRWQASQIIEHIAKTNLSICIICKKLLKSANNGQPSPTAEPNSAELQNPSEVKLNLSQHFVNNIDQIVEARKKLQAPDFVKPTGVKLSEALKALDDSLNELRNLRQHFAQLSRLDTAFPHPFLGNLNASEWLLLAPLHAKRHFGQLKALLE